MESKQMKQAIDCNYETKLLKLKANYNYGYLPVV